MADTDYQGQLTQAIDDLKAEVGQFMQTDAQLDNIIRRANAYRNSSAAQVVAKAVALVDKATGLRNVNASLEAQAQDTISKAGQLNAAMQSDPQWQSILSADWSSFGWATLAAAKQKVGQVVTLVGDLYSLKKNMDDQVAKTQDAQSDMDDLDNYAQGKGLTARLDQAGGFFGGVIQKETTILSVGAVLAGVVLFLIYVPRPRRRSA